MQNYQPYYPMNNMQQIQPMQNFAQNFQQTMNPYLEKVQQLNQMQQIMNNPQNILNGRMVENFDQITANEVPMDGRVSVFIKSDMSEIEIRQWNSNGTIGKMSFKPVLESEPIDVPSVDAKSEFEQIREILGTFNDRFDGVEKALEKISKPTRARKEE